MGPRRLRPDIGGWATFTTPLRSIEDIGGALGRHNMQEMFYHASSFNQDIGGWDTVWRHNHERMFGKASAFNRDIGDWAVHSVTIMT